VGDQTQSQRVVDSPVAQVQRIGERGTGRWRGDTHVKQLGLVGFQTCFDVAQGLAPSELRKGHDAKQVGATKCSHTGIALVPLDDASKGFPRHELHHLRKQRLAHVHAALPVVESRKHRK
jgi:hypothetical protein